MTWPRKRQCTNSKKEQQPRESTTRLNHLLHRDTRNHTVSLHPVMQLLHDHELFSTGGLIVLLCWKNPCKYMQTIKKKIPVLMRISAPVQTGPEAHPASCTMGTRSFPGVKCGVLLTTHPFLAPRSWKSRAIPLPSGVPRGGCVSNTPSPRNSDDPTKIVSNWTRL